MILWEPPFAALITSETPPITQHLSSFARIVRRVPKNGCSLPFDPMKVAEYGKWIAQSNKGAAQESSAKNSKTQMLCWSYNSLRERYNSGESALKQEIPAEG